MDDFQAHNSIKKMGDWGGIVQYGGERGYEWRWGVVRS